MVEVKEADEQFNFARDAMSKICEMPQEDRIDFLISFNYGVACALAGKDGAEDFLKSILNASSKIAIKLRDDNAYTQH